MIRKPEIDIKDFSYDLPEDRIAQFPLEQRDMSKLLTWKDGEIGEDIFYNIDKHIPGNSLIIFNDTKVIRARLLFTKSTGTTIEIFCLEPLLAIVDLKSSLSENGSTTWQCLVGNVKRWKGGILEKSFKKDGQPVHFTAEKKGFLGDGCFSVEFKWDPVSLTFAEILEETGQVPLPPYIHRQAVKTDAIRYQTIYANHDGSVAAPTAGLHFTDRVLKKLNRKKIVTENVTLHVGLGTFRPVSVPEISDHIMHDEKIIVKLETILKLIEKNENPVIGVGTTSVRTLESLYWTGVKLIIDKPERIPEISQWDPYNERYNCGIPKMDALQILAHFLIEKELAQFSSNTQLLIAPGYEIRMINGMITNFHIPQSTLLLLIAAFMGSGWREAYEYALDHHFRFLSYGDSCLLIKTNN